MQPHNDKVVGWESAEVLPCSQTETYRANENGEGRGKRVSEDGRKRRGWDARAQAASIMWFGAEAICTYCSS